MKGCEDKGMDVYVPIPMQLGRKGKGDRFGSDDFRYDPQDDTYVCPAGQRLARSNETTIKHDKLYFVYRSAPDGCRGCALSSRCLEKANPRRRVERWEHADWVDRHRKKMNTASPLMRGRAALVEHPFGTIRRWAGIDHFLMRGLDKCRGEFSLMALGYNFKRMVNELGADAFREHCLQKQRTPAIGV